MSEWNFITLKEAGVQLIDCVHMTPEAKDNGYYYIAIPQMKDGRIDTTDARLISEEDYKKWTTKANPKKWDIVLSRRCNPGVTSIVTGEFKFALGQNLVLLRSDGSKIHPPFLKWLVKSKYWWKEVSKYLNVGAVFESLKCADVPNFELPVPDIETQKEISKTLESIDSKITLLHRQNKDLEELAQTIFKRWFVEFEFPNENREPYKSSGGKMVESELGEIPEGWKAEHLRNEIIAIKGLSYKGAGLAEKGTVMHSLKSILEGGGYRHDGIKHYNAEYKERHIVRSGDIIVANTEQGEKHMLIGYPARIPDYVKGDSIFTHHLTKIEKLPESFLSNEFIYYSLMAKQLRHQIISYTNGTTVNGLPTDGLLEPVWIVPTKNIIESFTQLISANWQKQENNYEEIQTLTQLRDTLLPKLMSGALHTKI